MSFQVFEVAVFLRLFLTVHTWSSSAPNAVAANNAFFCYVCSPVKCYAAICAKYAAVVTDVYPQTDRIRKCIYAITALQELAIQKLLRSVLLHPFYSSLIDRISRHEFIVVARLYIGSGDHYNLGMCFTHLLPILSTFCLPPIMQRDTTNPKQSV